MGSYRHLVSLVLSHSKPGAGGCVSSVSSGTLISNYIILYYIIVHYIILDYIVFYYIYYITLHSGRRRFGALVFSGVLQRPVARPACLKSASKA